MRPTRTLWLALIVCLATVPALSQKGKPKAVDQPVRAMFRSTGLGPPEIGPEGEEYPRCGPDALDVKDCITGDDDVVYEGTGDVITGSGAFLRADGEFALIIRPTNGRTVYLNFAQQISPPSGTFYRKNFTTQTLNSFNFNTNLIDPATRLEVSGGLPAMAVGARLAARIRAFWTDPGGFDYTIRFNPDHYPGSTYATVTRVGDYEWTIEAFDGDAARLVSPPERRKGVSTAQTDEGLYHMPFHITVVALP
jgi:hypothetical protein